MSTQQIRCEVCRANDIVPVLNLGSHPLCDDLIPVGRPETCEEFQIEISLCRECLTAHQVYPVPKRRLFPSTYHYRSAMTQDVLDGMRGLVAEVKAQYGDLKGKFVVDVGCNDGSLLKFFAKEGAKVCGIEPTAAAQDAQKAGVPVINDYLDPQSALRLVTEHGNPDFVTFTNVFAHIENMDELLESVAILLGSNGRLVVENHYLGAVLDRFQFDTFYHEHPRTYSLTSFAAIGRRLGRKIESYGFPSRYGGNIRVIIGPGEMRGNPVDEITMRERTFIDRFGRMREVIRKWIGSRDALLGSVRCSDGKIYAKAFPGRAAIMIKMLGLTEADIAAVFEKPRSMKIGHYLPGTRIPIMSDDDLLRTIPEPRRILNLAWHIRSEIRQYLLGLDPKILCADIFAPDDFDSK
jgi:SAM-dependent methyltransferase